MGRFAQKSCNCKKLDACGVISIPMVVESKVNYCKLKSDDCKKLVNRRYVLDVSQSSTLPILHITVELNIWKSVPGNKLDGNKISFDFQ